MSKDQTKSHEQQHNQQSQADIAEKTRLNAEAAKAVEAAASGERELLAKLLDTQNELLKRQAELEAQIATLKGKATGERPTVRLRGACDPKAEAIHQASTWPKDADRRPGKVVTRTYSVTPVGAAIEQGLGPAIVDNCYDSSDAKAAYMRQYKPELHHLPVQIHEVKPEASSAA
jgi:hypothetical protein